MHFDDRLATVLRSRASGEAMARVQYRQLLDLLGTLPVEAEGPQIDAACDRLGELASAIPAAARAAMLREPGMRLRSPRLVAMLAGGEPTVAAATIAAARLGEEEWIDLAPALPPSARALIGQRRDVGPRAAALFARLGLSPPRLPAGETDEVLGEPARSDDIGAIVQRIEHFRKAREPHTFGEAADQPQGERGPDRPPARLRAFDFATDAEGCIVWSDPGMAPMALGLRLASLSLGQNKIKDLSPLAKVNRLSVLDLKDNQVEDLSPLASQTDLKILILEGNQIKDLTPLVKAAKASIKRVVLILSLGLCSKV